jgi:hypothetical protein
LARALAKLRLTVNSILLMQAELLCADWAVA